MKGWRTIETVKSWANKKVLSTVLLLNFGRAGALSYYYYYDNNNCLNSVILNFFLGFLSS